MAYYSDNELSCTDIAIKYELHLPRWNERGLILRPDTGAIRPLHHDTSLLLFWLRSLAVAGYSAGPQKIASLDITDQDSVWSLQQDTLVSFSLINCLVVLSYRNSYVEVEPIKKSYRCLLTNIPVVIPLLD